MTEKDSKRPLIDGISYSLIHDGSIRCSTAITTDTVKTAQKKHNLDPMTTIALGRALTCAALLGSSLKDQDHYIKCSFIGDGPIRQIIAEYINPSALRGFVAVPQLNRVIGEGDRVPQTVGEALGKNGKIVVKKGSLAKSEDYTSVCKLESGEIAEDVARYLLDSEQIRSVVGAGVHLDKDGKVLGSGGFIIQKLGGQQVPEKTLNEIEERVKSIDLSQRIANGASGQDIFTYLTDIDKNLQNLEFKPLGYRCFCSRSRMALALMSLGETELKAIKEETGKIETTCQYCGTVESFELNELLKH